MGREFMLEGYLREDGLVRFTCEELPGFRLLLKSQEDVSAYDQDIKEALNVFMPLYIAAETRSKSIGIQHRDRHANGHKGRGIELVASFPA